MSDVQIDLSAIEAQIATMSEEDIRKQLLEIKTRQRVMQKKYNNPETQKRARLKKAARDKAMVEAAKKLGIYDQILEEAKEAAEVQLAEQEADQEAPVEV